VTLDFDNYQRATGETAVYPESGTGSALALAYVGLGLGEAGEIQGKIKKVLRDDGGVLTGEKRSAIAAEVGDLLWYAAQVATELNLPLGFIAEQNLAKLASRKERGVLQGSGDNR
jgi:NTP pyrophosphatase (non-canonical NTP hydrolase)